MANFFLFLLLLIFFCSNERVAFYCVDCSDAQRNGVSMVVAEDREATNSTERPFLKNEAKRAIGQGSISGCVTWFDAENLEHPLIGAKIKVSFPFSWGFVETYSDDRGYFDISFSNMWTASIEFEADISVIFGNSLVSVADSNGQIYSTKNHLDGYSGGNKEYSLTFERDTALARVASIFSAVNSYANYAKNISGGNIPKCTVLYPDVPKGASYTADTIHLPRESEQFIRPVYASWDVIGHEYGHHLQKHFFYRDYYGEHYSDCTAFESYIRNKEIYGERWSESYTLLDESEYYAAKKWSLGLAWSEAWATFFSIVAQSGFCESFRRMATVGDAIQTGFNTGNYNLDSFWNCRGETSETTIACFMYQLWDAQSGNGDVISLGMSDIWSLMCSNNPEYFCDFLSCLEVSNLSFEREDLWALEEVFGFSPSTVLVSCNMHDFKEKPTFRWQGKGFSVTYKNIPRKTYDLENDKFDILFYDSNKNLIAEVDWLDGTSFTPPDSIWEMILAARGSAYYVRVRGYDTFGGLSSGPYSSRLYAFQKPSEHTFTSSLDATGHRRFYEERVVIPAGGVYRMVVSFPVGGSKIFQTFGEKDTCMKLFDADGRLLKESDDDGYGRNAFICHYVETNREYTLEVTNYSQSIGGETKVTVTPISGFLENGHSSFDGYDDILNINSTYSMYLGGWLVPGKSNVLTWTPLESGLYQINLVSEFDNFLYVLDPTSTDTIEKGVSYDDDGGEGRNASITSYFSSEKTYYVVVAQYDNNNPIEENEVIDIQLLAQF